MRSDGCRLYWILDSAMHQMGDTMIKYASGVGGSMDTGDSRGEPLQPLTTRTPSPLFGTMGRTATVYDRVSSTPPSSIQSGPIFLLGEVSPE